MLAYTISASVEYIYLCYGPTAIRIFFILPMRGPSLTSNDGPRAKRVYMLLNKVGVHLFISSN